MAIYGFRLRPYSGLKGTKREEKAGFVSKRLVMSKYFDQKRNGFALTWAQVVEGEK